RRGGVGVTASASTPGGMMSPRTGAPVGPTARGAHQPRDAPAGHGPHEADLVRARELLAAVRAVERVSLASLNDDALLDLLSEHRWAISVLARPHLPLPLRSVLNAAVLAGHGLLHRRPRRRRSSLSAALRRGGRAVGGTALVFVGAAGLAFAAVLGDPTLALAVIPRAL